MRKRPSYWPSERSLFRDKGKRRNIAVWALLVLSIVAAVAMAALWRYPPI